MFRVEAVAAKVEMKKQSELDGIIENVSSDNRRPLLRSLLTTARSVAGLDSGPLGLEAVIPEDSLYRRRAIRGESMLGDMLVCGTRLEFIQPAGSRLMLLEVRRHDTPSSLKEFGELVERAARSSLDGRRVRGMDFTWRKLPLPTRVRIPGVGPAIAEAKLETKVADFSQVELAQSSALATSEYRAALLRLAQVGKARLVDPIFQMDNPLMSSLLSRGLVRREYLVTCRQDSHTICTVEDRRQLESNAGSLRCSICGRQFSNEQIHEIAAITEDGRRILGGSRWMTVWVTGQLFALGLEAESVAWNAAASEDELDIIVKMSGLQAFLELKDREFGLGDAYPFAARVSRYGGDFGIILTTDRVAEEARRFLEEPRPGVYSPNFEFLEGVEDIQSRLPELADRISQVAVRRQLTSTLGILGSSVIATVDAWMKSRCSN